MSKKWYKKNAIQAAFIVGIFAVIATLIPSFFDKSSIKRSNLKLELVDLIIHDDLKEINKFWIQGLYRNNYLPPDKVEKIAVKDCTGDSILYTKNQEFRKGFFPIIEFKFRNPSDEVVFLKNLKFYLSIDSLKAYTGLYSAIPLSWYYSLLIDGTKKRDTLSLNISQAIKPNDVDRFAIIVGSDGSFEFAKYKISMELLYNDYDKILLGEYFLKIQTPIDNILSQRQKVGVLKFE